MQEINLPVLSIVKQSYGWVRHHPRLLAPPMAVLYVANFMQDMISTRVAPDAWTKIAMTFMLFVVDGAFSVGLFRTLILDEVRGGVAFLRWGFELWRYLKTIAIASIGILLLGLAVLVAAGAKFGADDLQSWNVIVTGAIAALPALYVVARLLLAFPAAALGEDKVFRLAWRISKGNALRVLAVAVLATLLPTVVGGILDLIAASNGPLAVPAIFASALVDALDTTLVTASLALSYRALAPASSPEDRPSADPP